MYFLFPIVISSFSFGKYSCVNYSDPKGYGASCFTDNSNPLSPQAFISVVPTVLFFTKANFFMLFAAKYYKLSFNFNSSKSFLSANNLFLLDILPVVFVYLIAITLLHFLKFINILFLPLMFILFCLQNKSMG